MQRRTVAYTPKGMEKHEREYFIAERVRLKRSQQQVAAKGGATQGTISKIETDPTYQPSVDNFKRALKGIDHTLLSFFGHFETGDSVGQTLTRDPALKDVKASGKTTLLHQQDPGGASIGRSTIPDLADVAHANPDLLDQIGQAFILAAINGRRALRTHATTERPGGPRRHRGSKKTDS